MKHINYNLGSDDWNTYTTQGVYTISRLTGANAPGSEFGQYGFLIVFVYGTSCVQIYYSTLRYSTFRTKYDNRWYEWSSKIVN